MNRRYNRRQFLRNTSALAAVCAAPAWLQAAPSRTLNVGCIGVGGKGESDAASVADAGHRIAAICDVDEQRLEKAATRHPKAAKFTDWRQMLDKAELDCVTVSTPDHTHAPATLAAISRRLHVYTQKPLTHSVKESRLLAEAARKNEVVTQMGIQHHSATRIKAAVELIHGGAIGKVREVHVWTDRPGDYWKQGLQRPADQQAPPDDLHWDLWIGVAPRRPYVPGAYHPFHWRGWWDFGTGALGDMGCHLMDPVISALQLGPSATVSGEGPPPLPESAPLWCVVKYQFPGTQHTEEQVAVTWYEAGRQPPREVFQAPADWPGSSNGVLFVGQRGNLFVGFPEPPQLFPAGDFADTKIPQPPADDHYAQWTQAIVEGSSTSCPFDYSGPLTETVLLGNVAYRSGETIRWNSPQLRCEGSEKATALLQRAYREGWEV